MFTSPEILSVCPGDDISLTCSINTTFVEWSVTVPGQLPLTRLFSVSTLTTIMPQNIRLGDSTVFEIIKISDVGVFPLVSTLYNSSSYESAILNRTLIKCAKHGDSSLIGLEKVINILDRVRKWCAKLLLLENKIMMHDKFSTIHTLALARVTRLIKYTGR